MGVIITVVFFTVMISSVIANNLKIYSTTDYGKLVTLIGLSIICLLLLISYIVDRRK